MLWAGTAGAGYPSYTVCPSSCDYATVNGAIADIKTNHATLGANVTITISGDWSGGPDTAALDFVSITTGSYTITVTATGTARHAGVASTTAYRLSPSGNPSFGAYIEIPNIILDGLQFTGSETYAAIQTQFTGSGVVIKNCLFYNNTLSDNRAVLRIYGGSTVAINNIIYPGTGTAATTGLESTDSNWAYNNTVYGFTTGIKQVSNNFRVKNNIAYNNTTDYSGTFEATSTNNLSKDTTAPPLNTYYTGKTLSFISTTNFHLKSTDTDAIDKGADLHADAAYAFNTDIDGNTRPNGAWDIGADEYVAAGTTYRRVMIIQ